VDCLSGIGRPLNAGTYATFFPAQAGYARHEKEVAMPEKKHLKGASDKEQRMYEHIKKDAKKEGRYKGREKEVAARTVMKQRSKKK
jgi:hypothetical protein